MAAGELSEEGHLGRASSWMGTSVALMTVLIVFAAVVLL